MIKDRRLCWTHASEQALEKLPNKVKKKMLEVIEAYVKKTEKTAESTVGRRRPQRNPKTANNLSRISANRLCGTNPHTQEIATLDSRR